MIAPSPNFGGVQPIGQPIGGPLGIPMGMQPMGMQPMGMQPMGMPPGAPPTATMPQGPTSAREIQRAAYQAAAYQYDNSKHASIAPEVAELAEHHGIDERATKALDEEMKRRQATFDNDMQALWIGLEGAKNPSGLLMIKIKDMRMGNFRGMSALDDRPGVCQEVSPRCAGCGEARRGLGCQRGRRG